MHSEWWDLQTLLTERSFGASDLPSVAIATSDTTLHERKKTRRKNNHNRKKLKRLFMCTTAQDSPVRTPHCDVMQLGEYLATRDSPEVREQEPETPPLSSRRFSDAQNRMYVRIGCSREAVFTATLYTPVPQYPNYDLCHLQVGSPPGLSTTETN